MQTPLFGHSLLFYKSQHYHINMSNLKLTQIHTYPIKSLRGIALESTRLTVRGPELDRRWLLIDPNGRFLTQRKCRAMALLQPVLQNGQLKIRDLRGGRSDLNLALQPDIHRERMRVTIWQDECEAVAVSDAADDWFSRALGIDCRLVYMPDDAHRPLDPNYGKTGEIVSFADGYPYLIIGEASLEALNDRLEQPVEMLRFRPNLVFSGGRAFEEDEWSNFTVNTAQFRVTKRCARCQIPTIDLTTAETSAEPTRTLAKFRRQDHQIVFGVNACWEPKGEEDDVVIKVGDPLYLPANSSES